MKKRYLLYIAIPFIYISFIFIAPIIMVNLMGECEKADAVICINNGEYYINENGSLTSEDVSEMVEEIEKENPGAESATFDSSHFTKYALVKSTGKSTGEHLLKNVLKYKNDKKNNTMYLISKSIESGNYKYSVLNYKTKEFKKYNSFEEVDLSLKEEFENINSFDNINSNTMINIQ